MLADKAIEDENCSSNSEDLSLLLDSANSAASQIAKEKFTLKENASKSAK